MDNSVGTSSFGKVCTQLRAKLQATPPEKLEATPEEQGTFRAKYEIKHLIGKGGFGRTYLVRDRRSDAQFASKQNIEGLDKTEADAALGEFKVMQQLRHEMLVEAFEAFCETAANGEFTVRIAFKLSARSASP